MLSAIATTWGRFRAVLYDVIIVSMTSVWYREVLVRLPMGTRLLDVGIGTATSLIRNRDIVQSKFLTVVGVDYDAGYIEAATKAVAEFPRLAEKTSLVNQSIHDYSGGPFDAIYFSGSFMIIPNKARALTRCLGMLASRVEGRVYFTQTLEHPGFVGRFMEWLKPWLATLTTIDFGTVTYERDFRATVAEAGLTVLEKVVIKRGWFRDQVLIVAGCPESLVRA